MIIERIQWLDSGMELGDGWKPVAELLKDWKFDDGKTISAGVLAYEDDDVVGLSHTFSPGTDSFLSLILIAKKNILTREVLLDDQEVGQLPELPTADAVLRNQPTRKPKA